jgi:glutathione S-transferase
MQEFIVHSIPGSPFGRTVLAMLEEKGASYRLVPVAPGTFRSPQHLARHPFGRVPVLNTTASACTRPRPSCATSIACCRRRR